MKAAFIIIFLLTINFLSSGQNIQYFELNDTSFKSGQIYIAEKIHYSLGDCDLRTESYEHLDSISIFLLKNKNINLEICFNFKYYPEASCYLHPCRIEAFINYLISKGIAEKRISGKNYFDTNPYTIRKKDIIKYPFLNEGDVLSEDYVDNLSKIEKEVARMLNRRIELKIISIE